MIIGLKTNKYFHFLLLIIHTLVNSFNFFLTSHDFKESILQWKYDEKIIFSFEILEIKYKIIWTYKVRTKNDWELSLKIVTLRLLDTNVDHQSL